MKDKIKEIYLSSLYWTKTHDNMGGVMADCVFKNNMSYEEFKKLRNKKYFVLCDKDYITNLQEEVKSANESITWWHNRFNALQEENKRLRKQIEDVSLDEANIRADILLEQQDYKSRINKAIDKLYCYGEVFDSKILQQFQKEMLEILQGEDK